MNLLKRDCFVANNSFDLRFLLFVRLSNQRTFRYNFSMTPVTLMDRLVEFQRLLQVNLEEIVKVAGIDVARLSQGAPLEWETLAILHDRYGLNLNWLISGTGPITTDDRAVYLVCPNPLRVDRYKEMLEIMKNPLGEQFILAKATETKQLLRFERHCEREDMHG